MATLLKADGTEHPITEPLDLAAMQRLVDGYIEFVTIGGTRAKREVLIVNEEGLLQNKPRNEVATRLYRGDPPAHNGIIVGDAIRCHVLHEGTNSEAYE